MDALLASRRFQLVNVVIFRGNDDCDERKS